MDLGQIKIIQSLMFRRSVQKKRRQPKKNFKIKDYIKFGLLVLNLAGLVLIYKNIGLTKDIFYTEIKAYLFVDSILVPNINEPQVEIKIKNYGKTPAVEILTSQIHLSSNVFIDFVMKDSIEKEHKKNDFIYTISEPLIDSTKVYALIAPNEEETIPVTCSTTYSKIAEEGEGKVFFGGKIEYIDIFGEQRYTQFGGWFKEKGDRIFPVFEGKFNKSK